MLSLKILFLRVTYMRKLNNKVFYALAVASMICTASASTVLADTADYGPGVTPIVEDEPSKRIYGSLSYLTPEQQKTADRTWDTIANSSADRLKNTGIKYTNIASDNKFDVWSYGFYNEWLGTDLGTGWLYEPDSNNKVKLVCKDSSVEELNKAIETHKQATDIIKEHVKDIPATLEGVREVYEWVADIAYDRQNTADGYSAWSGVVHGYTTCNGHAKIFSEALKDMGVEVYYILGNADGGFHAWNAFVIDGKTYTVDTTFACSYPRGSSGRDKYFLGDGSMTMGDATRTVSEIY